MRISGPAPQGGEELGHRHQGHLIAINDGSWK